MSLPVVYIDDEIALCRVFTMLLQGRGVPAVTFTEATEGIVYLQEHQVALVLCDHRMPGVSGTDVLDAFLRAGGTAPFYIVSGDLGSAGTAGRPGLTGMLAKPFRAEALFEIVERHRRPAEKGA